PAALRKAFNDRDTMFRALITRTAPAERDTMIRRARIGHHPSEYGYVRQYTGFVLSGKKVIYVNALLKRSVENPSLPQEYWSDWRHHADVVCDGGDLFFGVEYDPAAKTFARFAFNGSL
ncbi:MAG TPA: hypothetical protein VHL34_20655, partial [Rhizomicrobium sp.]|nr:hypothetical protein [Rhizomicrobium sp.]